MIALMIPATVVAQVVSPNPVDLGTSGDFVVLAKTAISTTGSTSIVGDIGVSPTVSTSITGFSLILDASGEFSTSSLLTGKVYAANYTAPTPAKMTTAVSDMEIAYTDAASRTPDYTEKYTGDLTGQTLTRGVYKWSNTVLVFAGGVTISGSSTDVFIFEIAGDLTVASGTILGSNKIDMENGVAFNGRALSETAVTLDASSISISGKTLTWNGSQDSNWANTANWDTNTVPIRSDKVGIPDVTNAPIIGATTGAVTNDLTITEPEGINITAGGSLIVAGTSSGNITYNVNVVDDKWHLVSSPVVGEGYDNAWANNNAIADGSGTNKGISTYQNGALDTDTDGSGSDTATGPWVYMLDGASGTFDSGTGYSLKRTSTGTYSFTGSYPTTNITSAITQDVSHWNLIGNPYPYYINIDGFITANSENLEEEFQNIYVWNASASSYTILTTGSIYPGQAFFISSKVADGKIYITEAMQRHQTGVAFYKTENAAVIDLNLTSGASTKSTQINYLENKTTGLDPRFDIGMFDGVSSDIRIYTHLINGNNGISFRRQALPANDYENMVIPIGIKAAANKELTFTTETLNLPSDIKVFLEDRLLNSYTRLDEANANYKVTLSEALNDVGRFFLHTSSKSTLSANTVALENISIYKTNNATLRIVGLSQGKSTLKMFNILGKQILHATFTSNGIKDISIPKVAAGIYIVQLETETGKLNKKITLE